MAAQIATTFTTILDAIRDRIVAETGVPISRVKIIARENPVRPHDPNLIFIRPRGGSPWNPEYEGGQRWVTVIRRVVDIPFMVRINTNTPDDDEPALMRASTGLYAIEEKIIDALHGRALYDGDGSQTSTNQITAEPMALTSVPQTQAGRSQQDGWTEGTLSFDVTYQLAGLDTTKM